MTFFAGAHADTLQRFRDGDTAILDAVYRTYADTVVQAVARAMRRYCAGSCGGSRTFGSELPDLVQEVFTRAFERQARQRFDGVREYGPYLARIARNVVVDDLRRRCAQFSGDTERVIEVNSVHSAPDWPGDERVDRQKIALVDQYVARLPAELLRVYEALYVQGLSQRQAAAGLGVGRQVVRTLESRLRHGLEHVLQRNNLWLA